MAVVRELVARFGIKFDEKGLAKADKGLKNLKTAAVAVGAAVAAAGAATAFALFNMAEDMATLADDAEKTAKQLGIGVEALQLWQFAAKRSGASAKDMTGSIRKLQRSAFDANRGLKETADAFDILGVSVADSEGELKGTEQLLQESLVALGKMENQTEANAIAQVIFGRAGTKLAPLFREQEEGMKDLIDRGLELGVITEEQAATGATYVDAALDQETATIKLKAALADALLPAMTKARDAITEQIGEFGKWLETGDNMEDLLFGLKAAFAVVALVTIPLLTAALFAAATAAWAFIAPFIPLIIAIGAFLVLGAAIVGIFTLIVSAFTGAENAATDAFAAMFGGAALARVRAGAQKIKEFVTGAFDAISQGALDLARKFPTISAALGIDISNNTSDSGTTSSTVAPPQLVSVPAGAGAQSIDNSNNSVTAEINFSGGVNSPERTGVEVEKALNRAQRRANRRNRSKLQQTAPT